MIPVTSVLFPAVRAFVKTFFKMCVVQLQPAPLCEAVQVQHATSAIVHHHKKSALYKCATCASVGLLC